MKKVIVLFALILLPVALLAQEPVPPTGWGDIIMNPLKWISDFSAVAVVTAFIAAVFTGLFKAEGFVKQIIAWVVAILILVVSDLLNVGYAAEFPVLLAVIHGFGAGLASNGVFKIPVMKAILDTVDGWFKPKT